MTYFDQTLECAPREQIQSRQGRLFLSLMEKLENKNLFYTEKLNRAGLSFGDIQSSEDLQKVPFTTKSELMETQEQSPPFGTNLTFPESAYTRFHQTSGTTGVPLRVLDTEESWKWWGHCWGFVMAAAGLTAEDRLFVPFSTYALRLAEVAREENFDLDQIPLRLAIHAGEPGANVPATKQRIEKTWGIKCFDHAGASEIGAHSFECTEQPGGIHVNESEFIVEVVDPKTLDPVPEGEEGELILTNLSRIGFPIIRYRTGDLVRLNQAPCACGRTFARFEGGVLGRADDMVVIRGVNVFPSAVENLVRRPGTDLNAAQEQVHHEISSGLGLRPEVKVVEPGTLPRFEMKAKRFLRSS